MVTIALKVPDRLANRLAPFQDRLPEIVELGLSRWQEIEQDHLTPRQQVEKLWAATGLIVSPDPAITRRYPSSRTRQTPIQAGGNPASQIIIEHPGPR